MCRCSLLFIVVPLLVGAISAQPTLGIGIVFPILMPLVAPIDVNWMTIMFAGIVAGYTASPLHLCLILTNQYYQSDLNKVYKYLIPGLLAPRGRHGHLPRHPRRPVVTI